MARQHTLWVALGILTLMAPGLVQADMLCPQCDATDPVLLSVGNLIDLVLATVLQHGVAVLLSGAATIVGLPWAIAAGAVAAMGLPARFRSR